MRKAKEFEILVDHTEIAYRISLNEYPGAQNFKHWCTLALAWHPALKRDSDSLFSPKANDHNVLSWASAPSKQGGHLKAVAQTGK